MLVNEVKVFCRVQLVGLPDLNKKIFYESTFLQKLNLSTLLFVKFILQIIPKIVATKTYQILQFLDLKSRFERHDFKFLVILHVVARKKCNLYKVIKKKGQNQKHSNFSSKFIILNRKISSLLKVNAFCRINRKGQPRWKSCCSPLIDKRMVG